jgi:hypothetical protein
MAEHAKVEDSRSGAKEVGASIKRVDLAITVWMARFGPVFLRLSLGFVFLWFGALKFVPQMDPARDLATRTLGRLTAGGVRAEVSLPEDLARAGLTRRERVPPSNSLTTELTQNQQRQQTGKWSVFLLTSVGNRDLASVCQAGLGHGDGLSHIARRDR